MLLDVYAPEDELRVREPPPRSIDADDEADVDSTELKLLMLLAPGRVDVVPPGRMEPEIV